MPMQATNDQRVIPIGNRLRGMWLALVLGAVMTVAAQEPSEPSASIVKIIATKFGSGVVVAIEPGAAVILTSSHVINGADKFSVIFAADANGASFDVTTKSTAIRGEWLDDTYGLATFRVTGTIPRGVRAAAFGEGTSLKRKDALEYWGYPGSAPEVTFRSNAYAAPNGRNFDLDRSLEEGASGGGLFKDGKLVGIAAKTNGAVTSDAVRAFLVGWGIKLGEPARSAVAATPNTTGTTGTTPIPSVRRVGEAFRDCLDCPEMVVIRAGRFTRGSTAASDGDERATDEGPTKEVSVPSFALGRYEVTKAQFQVFATATGVKTAGCGSWDGKAWVDDASRSWQSPGFEQTATDPVVCVSWEEASAYVRWLSQRTQQTYRLPSEAEWEYAARAGTTTRRYWGNDSSQACGYANVADQTGRNADAAAHSCADGYTHTAPVGRFKPNAFDLYDMLGNAWEWTEDCYHSTYSGAPDNGGSWTTGDCRSRMARGGSWGNPQRFVRSALRNAVAATTRYIYYGLRVARVLPQ